MAKITILPDNRSFSAPAGESLYKALLANGVELESICGGRGTCGKCRVTVTGGTVAGRALGGHTYLACKTVVEGDVAVSVARAGDASGRKSSLYKKASFPIKAGTSKFFVRVPGPSLQDQSPDWERLTALLPGGEQCYPTAEVLVSLPDLLREADFEITAVIRDNTVIALEKGDTTSRIYGLSFDIGTTTVVGFLVDLVSGEVLAVLSEGNPQRAVGADVISRVEYVSSNPRGGQFLKEKITAALNSLTDQLLAEAGVDRRFLYEVTLVGNTTMQHLLLGINPYYLAQSPYVPAIKAAVELPAEKMGLNTAPGGKVYILPNIAGFVGSDTVGVILSTGMHRQDGIRLAIDIGTNGEVALGSRDRMLVCSTAAGPAFEGARISHGMRAVYGAIEGVKIAGGEVSCKVIGDSYPALGICGSGLIQCAAEMLRSGIIDSTGKMLSPEKARAGSDPFLERIESREDQTVFLLVPEDSNTDQRTIYITQKDIRELQLAKGAIAAGIQILMKEMAITPGEIEEVFLAGAFGSYVDIDSAILLGLLPPVPPDKIKSVGNAAGMGALQALLSLDARGEAQRIAAGANNIELSGRVDFQAAFVDALGF